jgi:hypothetical protein
LPTSPKKLCLPLLVAAAAVANAADLLPAQTFEGEIPGWRSFHEEPGTRTSDVWKLEKDGVLVCRGKPLGYLFTTNSYQNFTLSFEWRWPQDAKPGNGGVLARTTGPDKVWPKSFEIQLNAGQAGDFWGIGAFSYSGPTNRLRNMEHEKFGRLTHLPKLLAAEKPPGEWNSATVVLDGSRATVHINGKLVNEATDVDQVPGKILLTSEGQEIHFRNLRLLPNR